MRFELDKEPAMKTLYYVLQPENWPIFLQVVKESAITSDFSEEQFRRCFSNLNNVFRNLKVELIASRLEKDAINSVSSITDPIQDDSLYELLGERSGIMVLSDRVSVYNITDDFIFLWTLPRDKRGRGIITWFPTDISYSDFISKNEVNNVHNNAILVLLLKKYAKVQTQEVVPNVKDKPVRVSKKTNTNKLPFKVEQTDCTWFTTYYTDVKIPVRGFMRWQACGVKHSERKLIYVPPFEKNGYHRKAKMLNCA